MRERLVSIAERIARPVFARAWPSYALVLLVQSRVLWRIWDLRDATYGDTAAYFRSAVAWRDGLRTNIVWSPLYTSFYGSFLWITSDPVAATTMHRVAIVLLATAGVLAVLRIILPAPLALLGAIWWAILPINFETLYEVHLFALLPILAAWILLLRFDRPWARGLAVAIVAGSTILVRNEFGIAAAVLLALCLVYEIRSRADPAATNSHAGRILAAYALPLAGAAAVCLLAYWRSLIQFPAIWSALDHKHTLNMCQVYAFGYQQRNPAWTLSPWLDCPALATEVFGIRQPTAWQMLSANFAATIEHYLWNLGLVGNGLQVLLFNAMSGRVNPDYVPVRTAWHPLLLSALVLATIATGIWSLRRHWWDGARAWALERRRVAIAFAPFLLVALPVVLTQRPRPSYFFYVSAMAIAATLASIQLAMMRCAAATRLLGFAALAVAAVALAAVQPYYVRHPSARPLAAKLEHVRPHAALIQAAPGRIVIGEFASEVAAYLAIRRQTVTPSGREPELLDNALFARWDRTQPLDAFLDQAGVTIVYLDPHMLRMLREQPAAARIVDDPRAAGWRVLGSEAIGERSWMIVARDRP